MNSQDCPVSSLKAKIKSSWPYTLVVTICCLVSFWIRTLPSKTVFLPNGVVKFATNDAWSTCVSYIFFLKTTPIECFIHHGPSILTVVTYILVHFSSR